MYSKFSKSPGPDGLHPRPLAEMAAQLAEPFQALFSTSLEEGILPQGWKDGNVTPIFKKGKKHQPGNYRPVSLTSIPCRVMKLVTNEIIEHLINNILLSKFQHGFIKARSCTTQLLAVLDDWTDVIEHEENVDAIRVHVTKFLGIYIDDKLNWKYHINTVRSKLSKVAAIIYRASCLINQDGIYICCTAPYFCLTLTIVVKYGETRIVQMWNV